MNDEGQRVRWNAYWKAYYDERPLVGTLTALLTLLLAATPAIVLTLWLLRII